MTKKRHMLSKLMFTQCRIFKNNNDKKYVTVWNMLLKLTGEGNKSYYTKKKIQIYIC